MNCRDLRNWLLEVKGGTALPAPTMQHLAACPGCERYWNELRSLDARILDRDIPAGDPRMMANFLAQFGAASGEPIYSTPSRWRQKLVRSAIAATAACILVIVSFGVGRYQGRSRGPVDDVAIVRPAPAPLAPPEPLVAKLAKHDMQLAGTKSAAVHARTFAEMAEDLQTEALRMAHRGLRDDLLIVAELHERILRRGLLGKWEQLTADERKDVLPIIAKRLTENEAQLAAEMRKLMPMAVELVEPMGATIREVVVALQTGKLPAKPASALPVQTGREPMLVVLCNTGLKLAEEADPLKRADICSETATQFAQASVFASAESPDVAAQYMLTLDDWLDRTIKVNLDLSEADDATGTRKGEVAQIRLKATSAVALVETHLASASPEVRTSVQNSLSAAAKIPGNGKAKGRPEQKGPPWQGNPAFEKGKGKSSMAK